jgi:hypothetical protein
MVTEDPPNMGKTQLLGNPNWEKLKYVTTIHILKYAGKF